MQYLYMALNLKGLYYTFMEVSFYLWSLRFIPCGPRKYYFFLSLTYGSRISFFFFLKLYVYIHEIH